MNPYKPPPHDDLRRDTYMSLSGVGYEEEEVANHEGDPIASWLVSLVIWDGLLPLMAGSLPGLLMMLRVPEGVDALVTVFVLILVFFARCYIGIHHVDWKSRYGIQGLFFSVSIFYLLFVEAMVAAISFAPKNVIGPEDLKVLTVMYAIYFLGVGIALFPFRAVLARSSMPTSPYLK